MGDGDLNRPFERLGPCETFFIITKAPGRAPDFVHIRQSKRKPAGVASYQSRDAAERDLADLRMSAPGNQFRLMDAADLKAALGKWWMDA